MTGKTFNETYSNSVTLSNVAYNPATVTGAIDVTTGDGLLGVAGTVWTVTNKGLIESKAASGVGVLLNSGGSVTDVAAASIIGDLDGIAISGGAGTVTNAGSITAGTDAVLLPAGFANRVVMDPGAVFTGTVSGGNAVSAAAISTLELASGASDPPNGCGPFAPGPFPTPIRTIPNTAYLLRQNNVIRSGP